MPPAIPVPGQARLADSFMPSTQGSSPQNQGSSP